MKMKPKAFTAEELNVLRTEVAVQAPTNKIERTADKDFPLFEIPVNKKVLVYVPNYVVINPETGLPELRMDKPWYHPYQDGRRFGRLRCIKGITANGYDGECPICAGEEEPWILANKKIADACIKRSLDREDAEDAIVKGIKREFYSERAIKQPDAYLTFPIVVLETEEGDTRAIIPDENGVPKHKIYWYTISKSAYVAKWEAALESIEADEAVLHPAGRVFILSYVYQSEGGDYNKRDAARNLQVIHRSRKAIEEWVELFDKEAEEWTPEKAMQTIYDNMFYEKEDLQKEVDRLLAPTRDRIATYEMTSGTQALPNAGFNFSTAGTIAPPVDDNSTGLVMDGHID